MPDRHRVLRAGDCTATFDLDSGARLASLIVGGHELLVQSDADPMRWGSYPMVPWAGRVRNGRFSFDGNDYELPITLPPHAIHGTAYTSRWSIDDERMVVALSDPWPFPCTVTQHAELEPDRLSIALDVTARATAMPVMAGWHPWFVRSVGGADAELDFAPGAMYELDHEMIPTGQLIEPSLPPWDNCFVDLDGPPIVRWPGVLELELRSSCSHWTVYTEPAHAICVEPQTDAPDAFNREPTVLQPGETLSASFDLRWSALG